MWFQAYIIHTLTHILRVIVLQCVVTLLCSICKWINLFFKKKKSSAKKKSDKNKNNKKLKWLKKCNKEILLHNFFHFSKWVFDGFDYFMKEKMSAIVWRKHFKHFFPKYVFFGLSTLSILISLFKFVFF